MSRFYFCGSPSDVLLSSYHLSKYSYNIDFNYVDARERPANRAEEVGKYIRR